MASFLRGARTRVAADAFRASRAFRAFRAYGGAFGAAFSLVFFAAPHADAFCRTTTSKLPQPEGRCYQEGLPLFWKNACVGYSLQADASARIGYDDALRVVQTAFETWTSVTCDAGPVGIAVSDLGAVTCSEVRYNPSGGNQNVIVFRDGSWPYDGVGAKLALGLTTTTFNSDTGEILDADLEINSSQADLSTTDQVSANGYDLLSVITHEAGHFLGLAHSKRNEVPSTMHYEYRQGTTELRSLMPDDIAGLCSIYPTASTRNVATSVASSGVLGADACDPDPRHGFVSECDPPPKSGGSGSCAASPIRAGSSAAALVVLGLGLALGVRRRRG